jgi:hypothetical protein
MPEPIPRRPASPKWYIRPPTGIVLAESFASEAEAKQEAKRYPGRSVFQEDVIDDLGTADRGTTSIRLPIGGG